MDDSYTDQQSRLERAFRETETLCVIDCCCGRTHFTSARGHGDYEDGELAGYQKKAIEQPHKYIESTQFDSISTVRIDGRSIVVGCPCGLDVKYADWIEAHARGLSEYLIEFLKQRAQAAAIVVKEAESLASNLEKTR